MRQRKKTISFRLWGFSSILFFGLLGAGFFIWKEHASRPQYTIHVGLLNGEKIWSELPVIKSLKSELNRNLNDQQRRFSSLEEKLKKENQQLMEDQQSLISGKKKDRELFEQRQQDFSIKVMQLQKEAEDAQKKIGQVYEKSMAQIREKVNKSIKKIARQKKLSLVLYDTQVAHSTSALDITDEVFDDLKDFKRSSLKW